MADGQASVLRMTVAVGRLVGGVPRASALSLTGWVDFPAAGEQSLREVTFCLNNRTKSNGVPPINPSTNFN